MVRVVSQSGQSVMSKAHRDVGGVAVIVRCPVNAKDGRAYNNTQADVCRPYKLLLLCTLNQGL